MTKTVSILALLALGASSPSIAATIRVPDDQPTIAAGLSAASAGDSVLVAAGSYFENVQLKEGVQLLGGWDASFATRDPSAFVSTVSGRSVIGRLLICVRGVRGAGTCRRAAPRRVGTV